MTSAMAIAGAVSSLRPSNNTADKTRGSLDKYDNLSTNTTLPPEVNPLSDDEISTALAKYLHIKN